MLAQWLVLHFGNFKVPSLFFHSHLMADCDTLWEVWVQDLRKSLCCVLGPNTFFFSTVPTSAQECKWVLANCLMKRLGAIIFLVPFCYVNWYKLRLYGPFSMSTDNLTFTWLLFWYRIHSLFFSFSFWTDRRSLKHGLEQWGFWVQTNHAFVWKVNG